MTRRTLILFIAFGSLLPLLAQKRQGLGPGTNLSPATAKSGTTSRETSRASTAATPATGSPANVNVNTRLTNNTALSTRLQPLLPAGVTFATASAGFRNQGQFVAALHASKNLNIPFSQLKADLTESHPDSLGQAIHALRPALSRRTVRSDVHAAQRQAELDIDAAELANRFSTNTILAARARALLPAGTNLQTAAAGFENARQLLLAEHVAHDLNIPFAQLKADVTATNPMSLKQAVHVLRPDLSPAAIKSDMKVARQETKADLQAAGVSSEEQNEIARR